MSKHTDKALCLKAILIGAIILALPLAACSDDDSNVFGAPGSPLPAALFEESFTFDVATAQCVSWGTFKASLGTMHQTMHIFGSEDMTGFTCSDPAATQALADAIATDSNLFVTCDGHDWIYTAVCGGLWNELRIDEFTCGQCPDPGYIIRPCIDTENWGGINTDTCGGPDQTMSLAFFD